MTGKGFHLKIEEGHLQYIDAKAPTLSGFNMTIPIGEWTCLLGRSGCGKSTLLRYLAGLLNEKANWDGQVVLESVEHRKAVAIHDQIAYMGQQDLLMPWLSALDNVLISTRFSGFDTVGTASNCKNEQREKALHLLNQVGLFDKQSLLPQTMSGGMRQRVAIARTLMQDKPIVLMDEPFSALDAVNRHKLQNLACELLKDKTVLLITHDPQEAIRLASKLYIMHNTPTQAQSLPLPVSAVPRKLDAECAALQQSIIERLEKDYE
ncbi:ABC transporter ATP-binding protein [Vibrio penaeicida]|uniref:ABC transporter ATP-binding protein n=1 Tax=Vibrio penaeicida TaxID=104609 RepID=UPI000CEA4F08